MKNNSRFALFHSIVPCLLFISILSFLILVYPVVSEAKDKDLLKATFIPQWVPQAQFAGYYMALHKGIYKKYGIDLTIIDGGPEKPSDVYLKQGKADFGTMWLASGISMRSKGIKVVNIAQMLGRSALMLVAKRSSGISKPEDLNRKKVGIWGNIFQVQPMAFFKKYRIKPIPVRQSYSVNLFLRGGVDAASAMWYNEYHTILMSGIDQNELTTFFFHQYGLNFPEDGIYTLERTLKRSPTLCKAFVKASIEGWEYAFSHPEETLDLVLKNLSRAHIPANRVHQKWMLERIKDLMTPVDKRLPMGVLLKEDYLRVAGLLKEYGLIDNIPDFKEFYRPCIDYEDK